MNKICLANDKIRAYNKFVDIFLFYQSVEIDVVYSVSRYRVIGVSPDSEKWHTGYPCV